MIAAMAKRSRKRPGKGEEFAELMTEIATGEIEEVAFGKRKNPAAVALGRLGGLKSARGRRKVSRLKRSAPKKRARAPAKRK